VINICRKWQDGVKCCIGLKGLGGGGKVREAGVGAKGGERGKKASRKPKKGFTTIRQRHMVFSRRFAKSIVQCAMFKILPSRSK